MTVVVSISDQAIAQALTTLRSGELVGLPTETVYGLAADATHDDAVRRIFEAKGRPATNPLIIHLLDATWINKVADEKRLPSYLPILLALFCPGPLTFVLPAALHSPISRLAQAGGSTVAVRIPAHPAFREVLKAFGGPLAAPSANRSTYISPTTAQHVAAENLPHTPYVLDGGACPVGLESTVIDCTGETPVVLRHGAITKEQLEQTLQMPIPARTSRASENTLQSAPGQLAIHYSPRTPLYFFRESPAPPEESRVAGVFFSQASKDNCPLSLAYRSILSSQGDLREVALGLFATLRELDQQNFDAILIDSCEPQGLGAAIMDRLSRAVHRPPDDSKI